MSLRLLALPLDGGGPEEINHEDRGCPRGGMFLNARRTHFGFAWEQIDRAPEAFIAAVDQLPAGPGQPRQSRLAQRSVGRTKVIAWKSKDGQEIEGLLTYPVGYEKGKQYPLLLVIHGGPMGAFMQTL